MLFLVVVVTGALVAWASVTGMSRSLAPRTPLRRTNYRGLSIPTACGIAIIAGAIAGLAVAVALGSLLDLGDEVPVAGRAATALAGFGLLGLWDDIAGGDAERGWRAHAASLRSGRPSSGAIKLVVGVMLAFLLVADPEAGLGWTVVRAGVVAGCANLMNLLDLRPGRASKVWLVGAAVVVVCLALAERPGAVALIVIAAAIVGFLPFDLRERAMLGDVGANAIGAALGIGIVSIGSNGADLVILAILLALHAIADKPGLSALIARVPPLRALDAAGRVPE